MNIIISIYRLIIKIYKHLKTLQMSGHILCPSCGNNISEVYDFIMIAKKGYYKTLSSEFNKTSADRLELCPNITKPIGFILDAAGLDLICCRMHMLGNTNFDKIYK